MNCFPECYEYQVSFNRQDKWNTFVATLNEKPMFPLHSRLPKPNIFARWSQVGDCGIHCWSVVHYNFNTFPGKIAFIGETKFAPGEWAGIVLDEPVGKNDGSVAGVRYFQCEPKRGVFARVTKLTRGPAGRVPIIPFPQWIHSIYGVTNIIFYSLYKYEW